MDIKVECYAGYRGDETPRRILFDKRTIAVVEVIDRWLGSDHRYFKVLGSAAAAYTLRQNIPTHAWEMTMYQGPDASDHRWS